MKSVFLSAFSYSLCVFAIGFVLGAVRVLFLAPQAGELTAVAVELPLMLLASYLVAKPVLRHWRIPRRFGDRLAMGSLAFAILMVFEVTLSLTVFGNTLAQHLSRYGEPVAWLGLAGQMVFAAIPLILLASENG
ncbi:hypothetical protein [Roseibium sediminicola]|uniref:Uncharacterized protein n=1 Tax=Roseibium sediminicola TaxID=2933272 RepID=A0ABT0GWH1_9HYPH|nr:hypothetical protein [Roseibium sp. CAU 1639]MCK7613789.1 hypothetical protein [Roseibium sp. CAU 1639]